MSSLQKTRRRKLVILTIICLVTVMTLSYKRASVFFAHRQVRLVTTGTSLTTPTVPPIRKIWFNWKGVLGLLPANVKNCEDLKSKLPVHFPWDYTYNFKLFNRTLTEILKAHPLKYQVEPDDVFKKFLLKIVSLPWINIICDVDFTFGYEQVLFSTVKPNNQIYTFTDMRDMWPHKGAMFAYVSHKFRRNVNFIKDKSSTDVQKFLKTHQHCEFMLMGQHPKTKQLMTDLMVLSELANPGGHIVIWELADQSIPVWEDAKKKQLVKEYFSCRFKGKQTKGIAMGHFIAKPKPATRTPIKKVDTTKNNENLKVTLSKPGSLKGQNKKEQHQKKP